jgi:serine/threonine-protein kinase
MEEMKLTTRFLNVIIDINQPGTMSQEGTYRPGPIVSKVVQVNSPLPEGTLLYGHLWTEGLIKRGEEAVLARWTEALLPDGRRVPVCFALWDHTGLMSKLDGSKPGQARLPRQVYADPVDFWP